MSLRLPYINNRTNVLIMSRARTLLPVRTKPRGGKPQVGWRGGVYHHHCVGAALSAWYSIATLTGRKKRGLVRTVTAPRGAGRKRIEKSLAYPTSRLKKEYKTPDTFVETNGCHSKINFSVRSSSDISAISYPREIEGHPHPYTQGRIVHAQTASPPYYGRTPIPAP